MFLLSKYELDEDRGVLIARAFVGVHGPDTGRDRRSSVENKQVELGGGLAVYTSPRGIGVTYEVFNRLQAALDRDCRERLNMCVHWLRAKKGF